MYTMKINEVICFFPKDTCQVASDISPNILKQTADLPLKTKFDNPSSFFSVNSDALDICEMVEAVRPWSREANEGNSWKYVLIEETIPI